MLKDAIDLYEHLKNTPRIKKHTTNDELVVLVTELFGVDSVEFHNAIAAKLHADPFNTRKHGNVICDAKIPTDTPSEEEKIDVIHAMFHQIQQATSLEPHRVYDRMINHYNIPAAHLHLHEALNFPKNFLLDPYYPDGIAQSEKRKLLEIAVEALSSD